MTDTLQKRLRLLIDASHAGNVNVAAKDMGVCQPTLNRIVNGTTLKPSRGVMVKIARFYGVTVEWMAGGKGDGANPLWAAKVAGATARLRRINAEADTLRREIEQMHKSET